VLRRVVLIVDKVRKSTMLGIARSLRVQKIILTLLKNPDVLTRNSTKDELVSLPCVNKFQAPADFVTP
jgi:hypothetical protein